MKQRRSQIRSFSVAFFLLCALVPLLLWAAGAALSDRTLWSQYAAWLPTWCAVAAAAPPLAAGWFLSAGCRARPSESTHARASRLIALVLLLAATVSLAFEWRIHRYLAPARAPAQHLRLVAWNPAADFLDTFSQHVADMQPGIVAIANRPAYTDWALIRSAVGGAQSTVRYGRLSIVSAPRVLQWGGTPLNITGSKPRTNRWRGGGSVTIDQGEAMFVVLDGQSGPLGRDFVVWFIDLPSEPTIWRPDMMRQAAKAMAEFRGPSYMRTDAGLDAELFPAETGVGFPPPDIIVGDFNTPRGMWSLSLLHPDMRSAFDDAGRGPAPSWPTRFPVLAIDHTLLAPWLKAARYELRQLHAGVHLPQVVDLVKGE
ncbi:MAG: endonuclease/exonuclease/phosphatase family protein [Phycisphaeraceae bacterium]|nr:endonuclease/exonuclease/phosphatase family protein [Phycisphaeraceae bacterium]